MKKYSFQSDLQTRCPFRLPFQLHDGNVFIGKINHLIIKVEQSCLITFKILSEWHKPLFTHANTVCVCVCVQGAKIWSSSCHSSDCLSRNPSIISTPKRPTLRSHTHTSAALFFIYYKWNITLDNISFRASDVILSLLYEQNDQLPHCEAAHKGGQIWTDTHFFWLQLRQHPKTHTSSVLATSCKHVSPQNHTEWPPRVAFLHTNAILSNLWKFITKHHTSSKTLDVHQTPPFPTFGPLLSPGSLCSRQSNCSADPFAVFL